MSRVGRLLPGCKPALFWKRHLWVDSGGHHNSPITTVHFCASGGRGEEHTNAVLGILWAAGYDSVLSWYGWWPGGMPGHWQQPCPGCPSLPRSQPTDLPKCGLRQMPWNRSNWTTSLSNLDGELSRCDEFFRRHWKAYWSRWHDASTESLSQRYLLLYPGWMRTHSTAHALLSFNQYSTELVEPMLFISEPCGITYHYSYPHSL